MNNKAAIFLLASAMTLSALSASADTNTKPLCNDGTTATKTGKGACVGHDGVKVDATKLSGVTPTPTRRSAPGSPAVGTK